MTEPQAAGVAVELDPIDGAEQGLPGGDRAAIVPRMLSFLSRHLRPWDICPMIRQS